MKFLCSNCKAKYQISDEKVAGRKLRMTCRQCKSEIIIRGDARSGAAAPPPTDRKTLLDPTASVAPMLPTDEGWHVAIGNTAVGPVSVAEVKHKLASGAISTESLVWREGFEGWLPMHSVPELFPLLRPGPPAVGPLPLVAPPPLAAAAPVAPAPIAAPAAAAAPVAQRSSVISAPLPGSVAPSGPLGDFGPTPESSPSQVGLNPLLADDIPRRQPSVAVMFALAGFVAFVLTATSIVGMHFLKDDPPPVSAPPPAPPPEPTAPELELPEEDQEEAEPEMVFELDDLDIGEEDDAPSRPKGGTAARSTQPKKKLTAEQKAMLERMGGDEAGLAGLKSSALDPERSRNRGGSVDAAALRKVVAAGQRGLKRCYDSALRTSGSDETVRLDVDITVSGSGTVTKVTTRGKGIPGLDTCIQRSVRAWRFPASGETFQTKFPVVFQPGA